MAIELPSGVKIAFKAGEKSQYDSLLKKDNGTLYFVDDNNKLYLYLGENPLYALIDVLESIQPDSDLPVQSKAIVEYFKTNNLVEHKVGSYQSEDKQNYVAPHIYLYDDGTAAFAYAMGEDPKIILTDKDLTSIYNAIENTKPVNGVAVAAALKTVVELVEKLPEVGTEGNDKKLWGLVTHSEEEGPDTTDFYYFPTKDSQAIKLGSGSGEGGGFYQIQIDDQTLNAETLNGQLSFLGDNGVKVTGDAESGSITIGLNETSGFVMIDPATESQTVQKDLSVNGNLTVTAEHSLSVDTIKPNSENPVTVEGNETVTGNVNIENTLTTQDAKVQGSLTVSGKGTLEDLVVNKTIENTNIFKTSQTTDEGEAAKFVLEDGVELEIGNKYYVRPSAANFPATNIDGNLTGGADISEHKLTGNTFTFDKGTFFITNDSLVSELSGVSSKSPLVIGAANQLSKRLEISKEEIQSYTSDTEANTLTLNPHGGLVKIGDGGLEVGTAGATIKGILTVQGAATFENNLTVSGDSTLTGALTANGDIKTTWFTGESTEPTEGLQMLQKLVFGSKSISAQGDASFGTLEASSSVTFNSTLQVDDDITFKNLLMTTATEASLAETDSREPVSGITNRLVFDGEYLLSKSDIVSGGNGLIRKELDSLSSTISTNKRILDEKIVIAANVEGAPPEDVTTNTLIWIDIAEDMGSGVIHIKSGEDWVPVTSTWY